LLSWTHAWFHSYRSLLPGNASLCVLPWPRCNSSMLFSTGTPFPSVTKRAGACAPPHSTSSARWVGSSHRTPSLCGRIVPRPKSISSRGSLFKTSSRRAQTCSVRASLMSSGHVVPYTDALETTAHILFRCPFSRRLGPPFAPQLMACAALTKLQAPPCPSALRRAHLRHCASSASSTSRSTRMELCPNTFSIPRRCPKELPGPRRPLACLPPDGAAC
jgi:hypothetical protein